MKRAIDPQARVTIECLRHNVMLGGACGYPEFIPAKGGGFQLGMSDMTCPIWAKEYDHALSREPQDVIDALDCTDTWRVWLDA